MIKVSVIVPVYNTYNTIKRCVDSIIAQTLEDIEIILVDDGSTDNSGSICDEYAAFDHRIKVIHKENGGLVSTRKAGVEIATGEYVGYVDSDDWIELEMYEALYTIAKKHNSDMVSSGYVYDGGYTSYEYDTLDEGDYCESKRRDLLENAIFNMAKHDLGVRGSLCCKLFRRSILESVQMMIPNDISYSEDKLCTLTFLLNCEKVFILKKCFYHYVMNLSSMTVKPNTEYLMKVNAVYKYLCALYEHPDFSNNMRQQAELYVTQLLIKGINSRMGFSVRNLMWIESDWQYCVPEGAKVLLYGSGELCDAYARQIVNRNRLKLVGTVEDISDISQYEYDYIVITIKYAPKAEEIRRELIDSGISDDRVLWFEQREVFWKYAEDAGLC